MLKLDLHLDWTDKLILWVAPIFSFICIMLSIWTEQLALLVVPFALIIALVSIYKFEWIYGLFFLIIPFSVELYLPSGLGTDLPSEPVMLLLTCIGILLFAKNWNNIPADYIRSPITTLLIIHIVWILFTAILSQNPTVSIKFFLAKLWYVIPFFGLTLYLNKGASWFYTIIKLLVGSLILVITYVMVRHAGDGFSFDGINRAGSPFFRNHVTYAAILVIILPYLWAWMRSKVSKTQFYLLTGVMLYILLAIYLTYTRAAHLCVFISIGVFFIVRYRLIKPAIYLSLLIAILGVIGLNHNNNYLNFAPQYEKTISHHSYDNLLEATYKLQDLSTMERVYRWVAGAEMISRRPILGYGPGNFYFFYKSFTVASFRTYVSHNPDKSGIHNYYLMLWVEQGIIGFLIFLILCIASLFYGEKLYHKLNNTDDRRIVMASIMSLCVIYALLLINDLIEADKVGPFFFFNLAILVWYGVKSKYITQENTCDV